ncbi:MAG: hypothetical protein LIV29_05470 [Denitrobacterium sp.]|jgi:hypothetical protein|nr:hypothetical protein [Denitrobacterium sp.]
MTANERISAVIDPSFMERIPSFVQGHAVGSTCKVVKREFPALYEEFSKEEEPSEEARKQMAFVVNEIFREHMAKHNL